MLVASDATCYVLPVLDCCSMVLYTVDIVVVVVFLHRTVATSDGRLWLHGHLELLMKDLHFQSILDSWCISEADFPHIFAISC